MKIGFKKTGKLYKGNTHAHTIISDGKMTPEELFAKYKSKGYSFTVLTDHIRYFNSDRYNTSDFLVLPGVEIHVDHATDKWEDHHITGLYDPNEGETFEDGYLFDVPDFISTDTSPVQGRIDLLRNNSNIAIYAHPVWSRVEPEKLNTLTGFTAIEIWNHECAFWSNSGEATFHWDYLLRKGRKVLGVASDDVHQKDDRSIGGYIMVQAESFDNAGISKAIKEGNFYSSSGPEINEFYVDGDTAYASGPEVKKITFITDARNRSFFGSTPDIGVNSACFGLVNAKKYVRVEFEDFDGNIAWSNPIYLDKS